MAQSADGSVPDQPLTEYDKQKLAAEQALEAATERGIVRGTTLRLATLFGQGIDATHLDRGVVAAMNRRAWAGEPLTMWHDGTVKRDLLCVDDAARAFLAALDHPEVVAGKHWLVGSGNVISVGDLFATIAKLVSAVSGRPPVPKSSRCPRPTTRPRPTCSTSRSTRRRSRPPSAGTPGAADGGPGARRGGVRRGEAGRLTMRVLFTGYPEKTHFLAMAPLAWALRTAGHEVVFASQPGFARVITQAGLTAVAVGRDSDHARMMQLDRRSHASGRTGLPGAPTTRPTTPPPRPWSRATARR